MEEEKMTPREIARLNGKEYAEPGRDLQATKPSGTGGDVDNPRAQGHSHGAGRDAPLGSDERARLARQRR